MRIIRGIQHYSLLSLLVIILVMTGCDGKSELPLYPPNLTPDSMIRIMNQRAMMVGGGDGDVFIDFQSSDKHIKFEGALAFDSPSKYRLQMNSKNEPPVADFIISGDSCGFYFPNMLKTLEMPRDLLLQSPTGLLLLSEAMRRLTGDMQGFSPYGVQAETKDFVFIHTIGNIECRAFIHRPTLTISTLIYSVGEEILFTIQYGKFKPIGEGVWPFAFLVSAPDFSIEVETKSLEITGRHSLMFYQFDELPGTQTVRSLEELGVIQWQD